MNNSDQIKIKEVFSDEDKAFNKMLVDKGMSGDQYQKNTKILRDHDFSSGIIEEFSQKWGLKGENYDTRRETKDI